MDKVSAALPFSEDVESVPVSEAADIQRVLAAIQVRLMRDRQRTGAYHGDVHVKTHGYAEGELRVLPNLPLELGQGLFAQPECYSAVVRFSNAAWQVQPDLFPDGRGMAIQVRGVRGEGCLPDLVPSGVQDFVMINHPVFFAANVRDYLRWEELLVAADGSPSAAALAALTNGERRPGNWRWREVLTALRIAVQPPAPLGGLTYFSMVPIRYGDFVAKYRVQPIGSRATALRSLYWRLGVESDGLRGELEATLRRRELLFEFQVQLWVDGHQMPIEDATVRWPESQSPFQTVAHLLLPRQEIAPR